MATVNNKDFIEKNPELAKHLIDKYGDVDWVKKYTDVKDGKIVKAWERNKQGVLVDVTARERAKQELAAAYEAYNKFDRANATV